MGTRKITSFISSENRQESEPIYRFSVDYPDGILSCREDEYIELNVLSFDMNNTMYNINGTNNQFQILLNNELSVKTFNIAYGNYSIKSLMVEINNLVKGNNILSENVLFYNLYLNKTFLTITYNEPQNTFKFQTFFNITPDLPKPNVYFRPTTMGKLIGLQNNTLYTIDNIFGFNTGLVNLIDYNKIVLQTDGLTYYYSNIQNLAIKSNNQYLSNTIFWKSKADCPAYQVLKYNNEDGGNSFVYKLQNKEINSLIIELKNERGEYILDAPNYILVIQYIIYEKEQITKILKSIDNILKQLLELIYYTVNRLRLLL